MSIREVVIDDALTYPLLRTTLKELIDAGCEQEQVYAFRIRSRQDDLLVQDVEALSHFLMMHLDAPRRVKAAVEVETAYLRNLMHVFAAYLELADIDLHVASEGEECTQLLRAC